MKIIEIYEVQKIESSGPGEDYISSGHFFETVKDAKIWGDAQYGNGWFDIITRKLHRNSDG
jgi:hypothetical protein